MKKTECTLKIKVYIQTFSFSQKNHCFPRKHHEPTNVQNFYPRVKMPTQGKKKNHQETTMVKSLLGQQMSVHVLFREKSGNSPSNSQRALLLLPLHSRRKCITHRILLLELIKQHYPFHNSHIVQ